MPGFQGQFSESPASSSVAVQQQLDMLELQRQQHGLATARHEPASRDPFSLHQASNQASGQMQADLIASGLLDLSGSGSGTEQLNLSQIGVDSTLSRQLMSDKLLQHQLASGATGVFDASVLPQSSAFRQQVPAGVAVPATGVNEFTGSPIQPKYSLP